MLNSLLAFIREYGLVDPGDEVVCAVSGGADSMALLWAMYLLRDKLQIRVSAAHFNHGLRGAESDGDEQFVRDFCKERNIPLTCGGAAVVPGEKGLEAAARDARYGFLNTLSGKIATAHTADDNAETVLIHMLRGTGLKGLGGIPPKSGKLIRPLLSVTRDQVLAFLQENRIPFAEDSTNGTDAFLRNRIRHHVMPLLKEENPRFSQDVSRMALSLRDDEEALEEMTLAGDRLPVDRLRDMPPALRRRSLTAFLNSCGVREPERDHVALAESLVFSGRPSASADLPGNIKIRRNYGFLESGGDSPPPEPVTVAVPGTTYAPEFGISMNCQPVSEKCFHKDCFSVTPCGRVVVRSRMPGDSLRLSGGRVSLKELFIDRKIPAHLRDRIAVIADDRGVIAVAGVGADLDRITDGGIRFEINQQNIQREREK